MDGAYRVTQCPRLWVNGSSDMAANLVIQTAAKEWGWVLLAPRSLDQHGPLHRVVDIQGRAHLLALSRGARAGLPGVMVVDVT